MRSIFGLVGILVVVGVIAMIWGYAVLPYNAVVVKSGQSAQQQAQQIAGVDQLGGRVSGTLSFQPITAGGKLRYLLIRWMQPGNSYAAFYGVVPGDVIETIGPQNVRDIDDEGMAKALAYEAYQRQWDLVIIRNNQRFTLPADAAAAAAALPATPGALPAPGAAPAAAAAQPGALPKPALQPAPAPAPAPPPAKSDNPLFDQIEAIRKYNQDK